MLTLVGDPAGTRRLSITVSHDAYDVLNRARIAASIADGRERTLAEFVGAIVETFAQDCDPVAETRAVMAQAATRARRADDGDDAA